MSVTTGGWSQQKAKENLFRVNKTFIIKNLSVTSDFVERLLELDIISARQGREITKMSDKDPDKVRRIMDAIQANINLRGNFELFLDTLDNTGHAILATCLRGLYLDYDPTLEKEPKLTMPEAIMFGRIMASSQYRNAVLKGDDSDAIPLIRSLKQTISQQSEKIEALEQELTTIRTKSESLNEHVVEFKHELETKERRTHDYITLQGKANVARENHLKRLETRLQVVNDGLMDLNRLLQRTALSKMEAMAERDTEEMKFQTLHQNVHSLIKELEDTKAQLQDKCRAWDLEKRAALKLLCEPDAYVPLEVTVDRFVKRLAKRDAEITRHLKSVAQTLNSSCSVEQLEKATVKTLCEVIFDGVEERQKEWSALQNKVEERSRELTVTARTPKRISTVVPPTQTIKVPKPRFSVTTLNTKEMDFKELQGKVATRK